ncbi:hypothetical protein TWF730_006835 [Orbilia blumenaviensis]|uniref:Uncharacterized protein n=1 Tax=Orbilia blumenaviensis TaxID=1796055 RepID=A0AAV9VFF9_9PEZI
MQRLVDHRPILSVFLFSVLVLVDPIQAIGREKGKTKKGGCGGGGGEVGGRKAVGSGSVNTMGERKAKGKGQARNLFRLRDTKGRMVYGPASKVQRPNVSDVLRSGSDYLSPDSRADSKKVPAGNEDAPECLAVGTNDGV